MEHEEQIIETIEQYLEGNLEGEELEGFEQRLRTDTEFLSFFTETRKVILGIQENARRELLVKLQHTETEQPRILLPAHSGRGYVLRIAAVAAGVALIIGISFWLIKGQSGRQLDTYLAEAMVPYENIIYPTQRSEEVTVSELKMAYQLYDAGQYAAAIQRFATLDLQGEEAVNAQFYTANAYMALEDYTHAIDIFIKLLQEETLFTNQVHWYLGLCYMKTDSREEALEQLEILEDSGTSYAAKAGELIKHIEE